MCVSFAPLLQEATVSSHKQTSEPNKLKQRKQQQKNTFRDMFCKRGEISVIEVEEEKSLLHAAAAAAAPRCGRSKH